MPTFLTTLIDTFAPPFLLLSPLTSYTDQILSIHRSKSSAGFSLDIPLIMLSASILKVFYFFGAWYSKSLLAQACLMIGVQAVLLKVALDNRGSTVGAGGGMELLGGAAGGEKGGGGMGGIGGGGGGLGVKRPWGFWRWRGQKLYWQSLAYFTATLFLLHTLTPLPSLPSYISLLGYTGLAIEAFLPVPQILKNQEARSCKGFRLSVLVNWLAGDAMKMSYFFFSEDKITWAFRLCGMFQMGCDCYLGVQYWMFGDGEVGRGRGVEMAEKGIGGR
ncbi:MAG: hypothetical protein Q9227_001383 [Pyrenula ochraceoflavens]